MTLDDRPVCTDAEDLARYVDGRLLPQACEELEAHVTQCAACRLVLAEVAAFVNHERGRLRSPAPDSYRYQQAIGALNPAERMLIVARYDDALGFDEIARMSGVDSRTARLLVARAVMRLRVLLASH